MIVEEVFLMLTIYRIFQSVIVTITIICAVCVIPANAALVTIDSTTKTGESDTADIKVVKVKAASSDQIGALINNKNSKPQKFTLKFSGLPSDQQFDVYVNESKIGTKTGKEISGGIELSFSGAAANKIKINCLESVRERLINGLKKAKSNKSPEWIRLENTLSQANTWVRDGLNKEKAYNSVVVVVSSSEKALMPMNWPERLERDETIDIINRSCALLMEARSRMYLGLKNPTIRNEGVYALTPVDFTTSYSEKNGSIYYIETKITNNVDIPISGAIKLELPDGWNASSNKPSFRDLAPMKSFTTVFKLSGPKSAKAPSNINAIANVWMKQDRFKAGLILKCNALKTEDNKTCQPM